MTDNTRWYIKSWTGCYYGRTEYAEPTDVGEWHECRCSAFEFNKLDQAKAMLAYVNLGSVFGDARLVKRTEP